MKKALILLVTLLLILDLSGCGTKENNVTTNESEEPSNEVEVEKELFDVTITIPASWYENTETEVTQESLDAQYTGEGYKSATLNEDGSVTIVMTKSQHKEMMKEIKVSIDDSIQEMLSDENYSFTKIEYNNDFTVFTATLSTNDVGIGESFATLLFDIYGAMYNIFNGTEVDNIKTVFCNSNGDVIKEINSNELGD